MKHINLLIQKEKKKTKRAQINRVHNDKFQETLRSSNLLGANALDWNIGPNGEVFVWYNQNQSKPNLTLSANSYITKVLLTEQDTETPIENGVVYNKDDKKNQY
ncbi:hypothetical protein [Mesoplasma melaleucae]|uniref:hypothetical protein n=1 Tax=Mesoplasma melaleucae TaxID=81459 RepID=UPI0004845F55|nr:hypothetical protein [Mesoplasma melaleucae]